MPAVSSESIGPRPLTPELTGSASLRFFVGLGTDHAVGEHVARTAVSVTDVGTR